MYDHRKTFKLLCAAIFLASVGMVGCGHKDDAVAPPPAGGAATLDPQAQSQMQAQQQAESAARARTAQPTK
ncbi:MAG: hypothetical protein JWQ02_836 [Capsulimonas sp.]|nr:hypothetical protein [Capsulimonas sp.]